MREGWVETTLANVLTRRSDRLGKGPEPRILTVTEGAGLVDQLAHWGRRVATEDVSAYKVVDPGDVVYNVYLLWNGAIGQNLFRERGVTSPVYEVFTPKAGVEPRYLGLLLRSPLLLSAFDSISIGSIQRRRRAPWQDFERISILLPPLAEQRRIVDLIGALDDAIAAAEASASATDALSQRSRDALPAGPVRPIGEVLVGIESGTSTKPVRGDGEKVFVMTLAAIRPGRFHGAEIKDVGAAVLPRKARLMESDLLITRSNTPDRVGYVCVARGIPDNTYIPDLVWRLVPDERQVTKNYLEQALSSTRLREAITGSASGTSQSMRKINKAGFSRIEVPIPGIEEQNAYVAPLRQLARVRKEYDSLLAGLLTLRSNLIGVLLAGEHEIPDSYDDLMGVAS